MTLTIHDEFVQGTPEWHDTRRGMVTASAVGKLITPTLKVADNDTSRALTATLVAERMSGWTEDTAITWKWPVASTPNPSPATSTPATTSRQSSAGSWFWSATAGTRIQARWPGW